MPAPKKAAPKKARTSKPANNGKATRALASSSTSALARAGKKARPFGKKG